VSGYGKHAERGAFYVPCPLCHVTARRKCRNRNTGAVAKAPHRPRMTLAVSMNRLAPKLVGAMVRASGAFHARGNPEWTTLCGLHIKAGVLIDADGRVTCERCVGIDASGGVLQFVRQGLALAPTCAVGGCGVATTWGLEVGESNATSLTAFCLAHARKLRRVLNQVLAEESERKAP